MSHTKNASFCLYKLKHIMLSHIYFPFIDSSITCASSSGTMSVSRCQLFEAGFHVGALHLREHSCNGTLHDGRLVFRFDNDDQLCGTVLRV